MRSVIGVVSLLVILLVPAWAQDPGSCSTSTIRGSYSVTCSGYISPAAGAPQMPATMIGIVNGTWAGLFTGGGKMSLAGTLVDQTVTGTATVNTDCTGSISYDQKINGQPAGKLNITFHVIGNGDMIRGMSVDPGTNFM